MLLRVVGVIALLAAAGAQADVYRYVDDQGRVQYTDKPQTLPAERLNIESRRTDVVELNDRLAAERAQLQSEEKSRQEQAAATADKTEAAKITAKDKADRCVKARERYDKYMNSHRLYEDLGDGQRRYLTDAEIDSARDGARRSMEELCK